MFGIGILSRIFARKVSDTPPPRPIMQVPLGLSPGSVWSPPALDIELARAEGGLIGELAGDLIVDRVGRFGLFGMDVWHIRFQDDDSLLQVVTQGSNMENIKQLRVFTLHATVTPVSREDWEFWLGRSVRDAAGTATLAEVGLIGGSAFQIDGPPPAAYNRQWPGHGDQAVRFEEIIEDGKGNRDILVHQGMEYARRLGDAQDSTVEYLYAVAHGARGHVKVHLGIDLDPGTQRVISLR